MHQVRRDLFVPLAQRPHADVDTALPIGLDQTISQPSLVALMTQQLELTPECRVLEIGTGSGYQTAILAELAGEVFTIERLGELAVSAQTRLQGLGYRNIKYRTGDGSIGWPEEAPFDAIIVTAAPPALPPKLVEQLRAGGRLVAPIGSIVQDDQILFFLQKDESGGVSQRELCAVRFVPLVTGVPPGASAP